MALQGLLKRLFSLGQAAPGPGGDVPPRPDGSRPPSDLAGRIAGEVHFLTQLEDTLVRHADVATGRVHLVGLEKIRNYFGDDWPAVMDKVHHIAQSTIQRRLQAEDFHVRYYDLSYMVVFADLTREQATLKCNLIAQEIAERVLGRRSAQDFVDLQVVEAKSDGVLRLISAASLDDIASSLDVAFQHEADEAAAPTEWVSQENIEARYDDLFASLAFLYRPVWNIEKNVISTYFCLPALALPGGRILTGYGLLPRDTPASMVVRLDRLTLDQVENDLRQCHERGEEQLLAAPVHFETLATQAKRLDYVKKVHALDQGLRDRLVLEVVGLPSGAPSGRVMDLVMALHPVCRAVLLRLTATHGNFEALRGVPVSAVGLDAGAMAERGDVHGEADMARLFRAFHERAARLDLHTYAHGVDTSRLSLAAVAAGFTYVDGDTVASVTEHPLGIRRFELDNLNVDLPDAVRSRFKDLMGPGAAS
ncbi:MAG: EAL domain-containing protein [Hyphomicrobiales bacterium]|nr:EAL domain-containing protein [Hyphomicrobiales bacterium]